MPMRIQRPEPNEYPALYHFAVAIVPDADDFGALLREQARETAQFLTEQFGETGASVRYAPDKWTVREVVGHLSDVERIMGVRSATVGLVDGLTDEFVARRGTMSAGAVTVRALLYKIAGHEIHHRRLLRERYLPLVAAVAR